MAKSPVRDCERHGTIGLGPKRDPDKVVPRDGRELVNRWNHELRELSYRDPAGAVPLRGTQPGWIDRDAAAGLIISMLGSKASAWNEADIRGETEVLLAQTCFLPQHH